jgi:hypothetical protein
MLTLLKVRQRMAVPTHDAPKLLTPTAQRTTSEAEPEIFLEIALRAVCQSYVPKKLYGDYGIGSAGNEPDGGMWPEAS